MKTTKRADPVSLACPHCGEGLVMAAAPRVSVEVEVGDSEEEASEASAPSPAAPPAEEPTAEEPEEEDMRGALAGVLSAQLAKP